MDPNNMKHNNKNNTNEGQYFSKCITERETKFEFVYIKFHPQKTYVPKSVHISIENIEIEGLVKPKNND